MDWKESISAWLIENRESIGDTIINVITSWLGIIFYPVLWLMSIPDVKNFVLVWLFMSATIWVAGRYTIRLIKAVGARRLLSIVWNAHMLVIATGMCAIITLDFSSNRMQSPIAWEHLELASLFCALSMIPAYYYVKKWDEDLEDVMVWPMAPAFLFALIIYAFPLFVLFILFFVIMYLVGTSRTYSDSMAVRDYLIGRSRDYQRRR